MEFKTKVIALSSIYVNPSALREPNKESEKWENLVANIADQGVHESIKARYIKSEDGFKYELVDGSHRYWASLEAGLTEIRADLAEMTDAQMSSLQFVMNHHRTANTPAQIGAQIIRLIAAREAEAKETGDTAKVSVKSIAKEMGETVAYVKDRMKLASKLSDECQDLVDEQEISLSNALTLAKLPAELQTEMVEEAKSLSATDFKTEATDRLTAFRKKAREGQEVKPTAPREFSPKAKGRKVADIVALIEDSSELATGTPEFIAGVTEGLKMAISLDATTVALAEAQYNEAVAEKADRDAKRKETNAAKKAIVDAKVKEAKAIAEAEVAEEFTEAGI